MEFVVFGTTDYMKKLATSKYLFNDNVFDSFFTKRADQVYINTWHGVPLSVVGKSLQRGMHNIGNIQKNLISADYLICPNVYAKQKIEEDYMIENIANGKVGKPAPQPTSITDAPFLSLDARVAQSA